MSVSLAGHHWAGPEQLKALQQRFAWERAGATCRSAGAAGALPLKFGAALKWDLGRKGVGTWDGCVGSVLMFSMRIVICHSTLLKSHGQRDTSCHLW